MPCYPIAIMINLLPLVCIHLCYLVAANLGHIEWCVPYLENCTSISATGRKYPEFFIFKGLMIPAVARVRNYDQYVRQHLIRPIRLAAAGG